MENRYKDVTAGVVFVAIGTIFLLGALSLSQGTIISMGPGFFPTAISILLITVGCILILKGIFWTS